MFDYVWFWIEFSLKNRYPYGNLFFFYNVSIKGEVRCNWVTNLWFAHERKIKRSPCVCSNSCGLCDLDCVCTLNSWLHTTQQLMCILSHCTRLGRCQPINRLVLCLCLISTWNPALLNINRNLVVIRMRTRLSARTCVIMCVYVCLSFKISN